MHLSPKTRSFFPPPSLGFLHTNRLAELLQASHRGKWHLRDFRKRQKGESGVCGTSASIKKEKMAFAELPQASKRGKWCLRSSRKRQKVFQGTCGVPARALFPILTLAGMLQTQQIPDTGLSRLCRGFFLKVGQILSLSNPPTPEGPPYRGTPYTSMLTSRSPYARNRP